MTAIVEFYSPRPLAVDSTNKLGVRIAGFLAWTSGTLTVTSSDGTVLINAVPVTAGVYLKLPFTVGGLGVPGGPSATLTLAGGASGTLAVA